VSEEAHRWKCLLEDVGKRDHRRQEVTAASSHCWLQIIQESILDGRQPKGLQLVVLTKGTPSSWEEQEKLVHFG
jgi:hypothetical protein